MSGPKAPGIETIDRGGGVVEIRFDNAPVNAMRPDMLELFAAALEGINQNLDKRSVILRGAGRHFCAGADIKGEGVTDAFGVALARLDSLRIPVIAAINGACAGGGLEIALCCDIRIATPSARFICAGVNMGLTASAARLPRLIGLSAASHALLTGLPITAARAEMIGLVASVVDEGALDDASLELARRIACRAPLAIEATKRIARRALSDSNEQLAELQNREMTLLHGSRDHAAAITALRDRTEPSFTRS